MTMMKFLRRSQDVDVSARADAPERPSTTTAPRTAPTRAPTKSNKKKQHHDDKEMEHRRRGRDSERETVPPPPPPPPPPPRHPEGRSSSHHRRDRSTSQSRTTGHKKSSTKTSNKIDRQLDEMKKEKERRKSERKGNDETQDAATTKISSSKKTRRSSEEPRSTSRARSHSRSHSKSRSQSKSRSRSTSRHHSHTSSTDVNTSSGTGTGKPRSSSSSAKKRQATSSTSAAGRRSSQKAGTKTSSAAAQPTRTEKKRAGRSSSKSGRRRHRSTSTRSRSQSRSLSQNRKKDSGKKRSSSQHKKRSTHKKDRVKQDPTNPSSAVQPLTVPRVQTAKGYTSDDSVEALLEDRSKFSRYSSTIPTLSLTSSSSSQEQNSNNDDDKNDDENEHENETERAGTKKKKKKEMDVVVEDEDDKYSRSKKNRKNKSVGEDPPTTQKTRSSSPSSSKSRGGERSVPTIESLWSQSTEEAPKWRDAGDTPTNKKTPTLKPKKSPLDMGVSYSSLGIGASTTRDSTNVGEEFEGADWADANNRTTGAADPIYTKPKDILPITSSCASTSGASGTRSTGSRSKKYDIAAQYAVHKKIKAEETERKRQLARDQKRIKKKMEAMILEAKAEEAAANAELNAESVVNSTVSDPKSELDASNRIITDASTLTDPTATEGLSRSIGVDKVANTNSEAILEPESPSFSSFLIKGLANWTKAATATMPPISSTAASSPLFRVFAKDEETLPAQASPLPSPTVAAPIAPEQEPVSENVPQSPKDLLVTPSSDSATTHPIALLVDTATQDEVELAWSQSILTAAPSAMETTMNSTDVSRCVPSGDDDDDSIVKETESTMEPTFDEGDDESDFQKDGKDVPSSLPKKYKDKTDVTLKVQLEDEAEAPLHNRGVKAWATRVFQNTKVPGSDDNDEQDSLAETKRKSSTQPSVKAKSTAAATSRSAHKSSNDDFKDNSDHKTSTIGGPKKTFLSAVLSSKAKSKTLAAKVPSISKTSKSKKRSNKEYDPIVRNRSGGSTGSTSSDSEISEKKKSATKSRTVKKTPKHTSKVQSKTFEKKGSGSPSGRVSLQMSQQTKDTMYSTSLITDCDSDDSDENARNNDGGSPNRGKKFGKINKKSSGVELALDEYVDPKVAETEPQLVSCLKYYYCGTAALVADTAITSMDCTPKARAVYDGGIDDAIMEQRFDDVSCRGQNVSAENREIRDDDILMSGSSESLEDAPEIKLPHTPSVVREVTGMVLHLDDDFEANHRDRELVRTLSKVTTKDDVSVTSIQFATSSSSAETSTRYSVDWEAPASESFDSTYEQDDDDDDESMVSVQKRPTQSRKPQSPPKKKGLLRSLFRRGRVRKPVEL